MTTKMLETAKVQTRKGVEGVSSRRQVDDSSGRGTGNGSSLAAVPRAMTSPKEQPQLPFSSGSRDLFPLVRDLHRVLPLKVILTCGDIAPPLGGRRVVRFELDLWETRAGSFYTQSDAGRLCGAGGCPGVFDAGRFVHRRCANFCRGLVQGLTDLDAYDSGAGSSTLASLSIPKLSLPVDATGACCLLSVLPDSAGRYLREPERMVKDAMHCAQVMSTAPEPYFDPVLVHRRRTYLELVRLLVRRGTVRFTLEPKDKVGLFAVRKDDGLKQRLIVDAHVQMRVSFSSEGFSKLEVDPDVMLAAWFCITDIKDCFHNMFDSCVTFGFFSLIPATAKEVGIEGSTLLQNGCKVVLESETLVSLAWSVLPMGCSWSSYFAQSVTEAISSRAPALNGLSPLMRTTV